LAKLKQIFPTVPVMALTATAQAAVKKEQTLDMRNPTCNQCCQNHLKKRFKSKSK
jgi:superfamily II DNA helicase RecQ